MQAGIAQHMHQTKGERQVKFKGEHGQLEKIAEQAKETMEMYEAIAAAAAKHTNGEPNIEYGMFNILVH